MKWHVFIAYAGEEGKERASLLKRACEERDLRAFVAHYDVADRFRTEIPGALNQARVAVLVTTGNSRERSSSWFGDEVNRAVRLAESGQLSLFVWPSTSTMDILDWPYGTTGFKALPCDPASAADSLRQPLPAKLSTSAELESHPLLIEAQKALSDHEPQRAMDLASDVLATPTATSALRARAELIRLQGLSHLGRREEFEQLIDTIDAEPLLPAERRRLAIYLAAAHRWERGLALAPDDPVVQQLIALRRDQAIPSALADDPTVHLDAAELHLQERRAGPCVDLARGVLGRAEVTPNGQALAMELLLRGLAQHWLGAATVTVSDPRGALLAAHGAVEALELAEPWLRVLLDQLELIQPPGGPLEPDPDPPDWFLAAQGATSAEELERVEARFPRSIGPLQIILARRWRMLGRHERALALARHAYSILPGRGQGTELGLALFGEGLRKEALMRAPAPYDAESWRLHVLLARDEVEGLARARKWTETLPSPAAWVTLAQQALNAGEQNEARRAAHMALPGEAQLTVGALALLFYAAGAASPEPDLALLRALENKLRERKEVEAEELRFLVLACLPGRRGPPADIERLQREGRLVVLDRTAVQERMKSLQQNQALINEGWRRGWISYAELLRSCGYSIGETALALRQLRFPLRAPLIALGPSTSEALWRDCRCLVGAMGLELLLACELHRPLGAAVQTLCILEPTWDQVLRSAEEPLVAAWRRELHEIEGADALEREQSETRREQIRAQMQAVELAQELKAWLIELKRDGKLEILPAATLPPYLLPQNRPDAGLLTDLFGYRECLHRDSNLVLLSAELAEFGVRGLPDREQLDQLGFSPAQRRGLSDRYRPLQDQVVSIAPVLRALSEGDPRTTTVRILVRAGFSDALDRKELIQWARTRGDKLVEDLDAMTEAWSIGAPLHASHLASTVGQALAQLWLVGEPEPDAAEISARLLATAETLDHRAGYRLDPLASTIQGLTRLAQDWPRIFVESTMDERIIGGPRSPGARMWSMVVAFCFGAPSRRAALYRGLELGLHAATARSTDGLTWVLLSLASHQEGDRLDFSASIWATVLAADPPLVRLDEMQFEGMTYSVEQWIDAARQAPGEVDGMSWCAQVPDPDRGGTRLVRIPIEQLPSDHPAIQALPQSLDGLDDRLAQALAAGSPGAEAFTRSPLRGVLEDPRAILQWGTVQVSGPRTIANLADLEAVLGTLERLDSTSEEPFADMRLLRRSGIPGPEAGVAALLMLGPDGLSSGTLAHIVRALEAHRQVNTGELTSTILALAGEASTEPVRRIGNADIILPRLAADLALAALSPPPTDEDSFAAQEPALLRVCAMVVARLDPSCDFGTWVRRSWDLQAWLLALRRLGGPSYSRQLLDLARAAPPSLPLHPDRPADLFDPHRQGPGAVDSRELMVLGALLQAILARSQGKAQLDLAHLRPVLKSIATRPLTADERAIRELHPVSVLVPDQLCAPDLALYLLLLTDHDRVWELEVEARLRRLDDSFRPTENLSLGQLRELVLVVLLQESERLGEAEKTLVRVAVDAADFRPDSPGRAVAAIVASRLDPQAYAGLAWSAVLAHLEAPNGPQIAAEWLLARARTGQLPQAVADLRAEGVARGLDEGTLLSGLARVLLSEQQEAAAAELRELEGEPSIAEALSELIAFSKKEGPPR